MLQPITQMKLATVNKKSPIPMKWIWIQILFLYYVETPNNMLYQATLGKMRIEASR